MKYIISALLSVLLFTGCQKKDEVKYTSMSVHVSGSGPSTDWTTTSVSTHGASNTLSISGEDPVTHNKVKLAVYGYVEGRRTYGISFNDEGNNLGGNAAVYEFGNDGYIAATGSISITGYTTKTINGAFDFTGSGGHISGTFKAPLP